MRRTALLFVLAVCGSAANAQFTILPQAGLENPLTRISYNNLPSFTPLSQLQPQLGVRADYKFKKGFGPFVNLSTSRSSVSYNFDNPETGMTVYQASLGKMQLQLQAGLQYSTKPIFFNKQHTSSTSKSKPTTETNKNMVKSGCSHYTSSCCQRRSNPEQKFAQKAKQQNKGWSLRVQPSAGFAFIPSDRPELVTKTSGGQTSYTYNSAMKTAFVTGVGFEFARSKARFLTVSINYFNGLGSNENTFTSISGGKAVTTTLNSKVSGWNASIGFPINLAKKPSFKHHSVEKRKTECGQYRIQYRCRKVIQ